MNFISVCSGRNNYIVLVTTTSDLPEITKSGTLGDLILYLTASIVLLHYSFEDMPTVYFQHC